MIARTPFAARLVRRTLATASGPRANLTDPASWPPGDEPERPLWLRISGLPRSVAPADLYRHVATHGLKGLLNVHLDYKNFATNGIGWLHFEHPDQADSAVKILRDTFLAAHKLRASLVAETSVISAGLPIRGRGEKGRAEAAERGIPIGNGPDARLKERGTYVYLWGLPGTTTIGELKRFLQPYGLRITAENETPIRQITRRVPTAQFLVRLSSTAGAHRLVRDFHMTARFGAQYTVRAQVMY